MPHRSLPLLTGLLVACAVPEPTAPEAGVEIPAAYGVATPGGAIELDWWKVFGDPVLDELIPSAIEHNPDLRAAVARLDAAAVEANIAGAELWPALDAGFGAARQRQNFIGLPFPGGGTLSRTYNSFGVDLTAVNQMRREGKPLLEAVRSASLVRFRAIMLTSGTTFVGLLPLVLNKSVQAQFLIPMGVSVAFGSVFATGVSLLLVPTLYLVFEDLRHLVGLGRARSDAAASGDRAFTPTN